MKVVVVTSWFPTPSQPVTGVFCRRDALMLALDHDVTVLHLAPPGSKIDAPTTEVDGPLTVIGIPWNLRSPRDQLHASRRIRVLLHNAELLHTMAWSSMLPMALSRRTVPWVHTEHWSAIPTPASLGRPGPMVMPALLQLERRPDVVSPVCEFLARPIRRFRHKPTIVVPCIVDAPEHPRPRRRVSGPLRLVAVGALTDRKDPLTAIRTLAELERRGVEAELTWVGDGELRDATTTLAAQLGLADRLTLTGHQIPDQVQAHLADSDIFMLPTKAENFFVSAAEALAQGRPAVVGSNGGQGEYLDPSRGVLVGRQSATAYADGVQRVVAELAGYSAEHFAQPIHERFSVSAVRRGYQTVYERAQSTHRSA